MPVAMADDCVRHGVAGLRADSVPHHAGLHAHDGRSNEQGSGIEVLDQGQELDAVFVQGGVGGLLCAVASWCAFHRPDCKVISVEPTTGGLSSGLGARGTSRDRRRPASNHARWLRNREVSPLAFESLLPNVDAFMSIDDEWAFEAMRALNANGIKAGASGSAALGGLLALCRDRSMQGYAVAWRSTIAPRCL
jgi:threonine dehydratase